MNAQQLTKFTKYIKAYLNSKGYDVYNIYNDKRKSGSRRIKIMGRAHLSDQEENKIVSELKNKFRNIPDILFWFSGHFFIDLPAEINMDKLTFMENKMKLSLEERKLVKEYAKSLQSKKLNEGSMDEATYQQLSAGL